MLKVPKPKKISKTKAKALAWSACSKYIRNLYAENGMVRCYTCSTIKPIKEMHAGHGISGRGNAVLFMTEVIRPQDYACNILAGGRYRVFTDKLIKELGAERYDQLAEEATKTVKYSVEDYLAIEADFKAKLLQISK